MKRGEDRDSEQGEGFFLLAVDTRVCPHPLRAGRCGEGTRPCCSTARQLAPTLAQAPARTELSPQPQILFCFFVFIFFLSATNVEDELTCAMLLSGAGESSAPFAPAWLWRRRGFLPLSRCAPTCVASSGSCGARRGHSADRRAEGSTLCP